MEQEKVHVFQTAGLGMAPFRVTGFGVKRGPLPMADGSMVGAPGQPMGTCQYCGTGIANCFEITSSDGRTFVVGSDCVEKTGDAGLRRRVKAELSKAARERRDARNAARRAQQREEKAAVVAELQQAIDAHRETLRTWPHPVIAGKSYLDYVEFVLPMCGIMKLQELTDTIRRGR